MTSIENRFVDNLIALVNRIAPSQEDVAKMDRLMWDINAALALRTLALDQRKALWRCMLFVAQYRDQLDELQGHIYRSRIACEMSAVSMNDKNEMPQELVKILEERRARDARNGGRFTWPSPKAAALN